jgi:hypothetical protein
MRKERKVNKFFVGKPEGKRPLGRREDGIRMDLEEIGWESGLNWLMIGTCGGSL